MRRTSDFVLEQIFLFFFGERCEVYVAKQDEHESVTELATQCEFQDYLQNTLRDRFITGMK